MRRTWIPGPLVAALIGAVSLVGAVHAEPDGPTAAAALLGPRPNIVLVLMDDFSLELLRTMPEARRMRAEGASYANSFVVDSLCCPSRTSLLTGRPPHLTGVLANGPVNDEKPIGGWKAFKAYGNDDRSFSVELQAGGYTTGFIGKFINGYEVKSRDGRLVPPPPVKGWSDFQVIFAGGYREWGFRSSYLEDGDLRLRRHDRPDPGASISEKDDGYATHVMARKAVRFIREHRDSGTPYFLEISTYGPHASLGRAYPEDPVFPPAFRDRPGHAGRHGNCGARHCLDLGLEDLLGYDDPRDDNAPYYLRDGRTRRAPAWRDNPVTLTDAAALRMYRYRAQMVQAIDRLLGKVRAEVGPDTYVVLTADNGFHLGQHQLNGGKGTPYDSDTRVPLLVVGPGVEPGPRDQFVSNIDLASTFEELAGVPSPSYRIGRSFAASLTEPGAPGNRYAFIEHTNPAVGPDEVDGDLEVGGALQVIPSYVAVRGERGLLVRVDLDPSWQGTRFAWELYRYDVPWEDRNVFAQDHDKPWARDLRRRLLLFAGCDPAECRRAAS